jgi:hypothetical protein
MVPDHVGDPQVFVIHRVVRSHEGERRLVVKVLALAAHCLMRLGEQRNSFAPAMTSILAP